jgi:DNA-binding NarL/FixJ family response regulator
LSQQRNVERQMQNLLVELSEMTRQITAQLDTRTQKLMMLIEEADQKIARLEQLGRSRDLPTTESFTEPRRREPEIAPVFKPAVVDSQHQSVYELADKGRSAPEIARELNRPRGEVDLILALRAHV